MASSSKDNKDAAISQVENEKKDEKNVFELAEVEFANMKKENRDLIAKNVDLFIMILWCHAKASSDGNVAEEVWAEFTKFATP